MHTDALESFTDLILKCSTSSETQRQRARQQKPVIYFETMSWIGSLLIKHWNHFMTAQRKLLRYNHGVISTHTNTHTHTHMHALYTRVHFLNFLKRSTQLSHQLNPTEKATGKGFLPEPRFKPSNPWSWVKWLCLPSAVFTLWSGTSWGSLRPTMRAVSDAQQRAVLAWW